MVDPVDETQHHQTLLAAGLNMSDNTQQPNNPQRKLTYA